MDKKEFLKELEKYKILQFGEFTLASGAKSDFYLDLRIIPYEPKFFSVILKQLSEKLQKEAKYDIVCGIPMAGLPFATLLAYFSQKPMIFIRKTPKEHGLKKLLEGGDVKGKKVLIVDDLISSGFSKVFAIEELRKEGAIVELLAVLVDRRDPNAKENVEWEKKYNIKVHSLFTITTEDITGYKKQR